MRPAYALAVTPKKRGTTPHLNDPVFRARIIALASCSMSVRGVAKRAGIAPSSLHDWLDRGRAQPDEEPYGSFAIDFEISQRGLEECGAQTLSMWVAWLRTQIQTAPHLVDSKQIGQLMRVLRERFPEDWGSSVHRKPEQDPNGAAWLDRHQLTQDQLVEMFRKPPEPVQEALVSAADDVYALLLASGWTAPGAKP